MKNNFGGKIFIWLVAGFFLISAAFTVGCTGSKFKVQYENKGQSHHAKKGKKYKHKKNKPPAHAPAHGYRAKYHYRYYPTCSVYYDSGRKLYFFLRGGSWEVGISVPRTICAELGHYVSFELDTGKPYKYHADHVKRYPPGKIKHKKKHKNKKNINGVRRA